MVLRTMFVFVGENGERYTVEDMDRIVHFLFYWIQGKLGPEDVHFPTYLTLTEDSNEPGVSIMHTYEDFVYHLGSDDDEYGVECKF